MTESTATTESTPSATPETPKKKRRHGPRPKPDDQQRRNRISIFLTDAEYAVVKEKANGLELPVFVLTSAIDGKFAPRAKTLPKLNMEAWKKLARVSNNINQIARHLNAERTIGVDDVLACLADFRLTLIGLKPGAKGYVIHEGSDGLHSHAILTTQDDPV